MNEDHLKCTRCCLEVTEFSHQPQPPTTSTMGLLSTCVDGLIATSEPIGWDTSHVLSLGLGKEFRGAGQPLLVG
jgi:hypothetical protein